MWRMTTTLMLLMFTGCATDPIQVAPNAQPVSRQTSWKKKKVPIIGISVNTPGPTTLEFGQWRVHAPKQKTTETTSRIVLLGQHEKDRLTSLLTFQLESQGRSVASVSAALKRKVKTSDLSKLPGSTRTSDHDSLEGEIDVAEFGPATFTVANFNSDSFNAKATGQILLGSQSIEMREVQAPWTDNRDGFAGIDFYLAGSHVGQVIRGATYRSKGPSESVWVSPDVSAPVQHAIAGMSAVLLLAERLKPSN